jgi:hypothetical protein
MAEKELSELYIRLAFQYESAIDMLFTKRLIDAELATATKEKFYNSLDEEKLRTSQKIRDDHETIRLYMKRMTCDDMVSLTELARQYSEDSPAYVIQSWMHSRNTLEFLRQWENDMNAEFDDSVCEELLHQGHTTSLTITPSLWIRKNACDRDTCKAGQRRRRECLPRDRGRLPSLVRSQGKVSNC